MAGHRASMSAIKRAQVRKPMWVGLRQRRHKLPSSAAS
jgi:hypothetical protein